MRKVRGSPGSDTQAGSCSRGEGGVVTQKARVLQMLKAAGSDGVRSDAFIREYMPRAAARVQELKDEGVEITSEREGKYVRWTLVGSSAESDARPGTPGGPVEAPSSLNPGTSARRQGERVDSSAASSELHPAPADESVLDAQGLDQARGTRERAAHVKRDAVPQLFDLPERPKYMDAA